MSAINGNVQFVFYNVHFVFYNVYFGSVRATLYIIEHFDKIRCNRVEGETLEITYKRVINKDRTGTKLIS